MALLVVALLCAGGFYLGAEILWYEGGGDAAAKQLIASKKKACTPCSGLLGVLGAWELGVCRASLQGQNRACSVQKCASFR